MYSRYTTTCLWSIPWLFEKATLVYLFSIIVVYTEHLGIPFFDNRGIQQTMCRDDEVESRYSIVLWKRIRCILHMYSRYTTACLCGIPLDSLRKHPWDTPFQQSEYTSNTLVYSFSFIVVYLESFRRGHILQSRRQNLVLMCDFWQLTTVVDRPRVLGEY